MLDYVGWNDWDHVWLCGIIYGICIHEDHSSYSLPQFFGMHSRPWHSSSAWLHTRTASVAELVPSWDAPRCWAPNEKEDGQKRIKQEAATCDDMPKDDIPNCPICKRLSTQQPYELILPYPTHCLSRGESSTLEEKPGCQGDLSLDPVDRWFGRTNLGTHSHQHSASCKCLYAKRLCATSKNTLDIIESMQQSSKTMTTLCRRMRLEHFCMTSLSPWSIKRRASLREWGDACGAICRSGLR